MVLVVAVWSAGDGHRERGVEIAEMVATIVRVHGVGAAGLVWETQQRRASCGGKCWMSCGQGKMLAWVRVMQVGFCERSLG